VAFKKFCREFRKSLQQAIPYFSCLAPYHLVGSRKAGALAEFGLLEQGISLI